MALRREKKLEKILRYPLASWSGFTLLALVLSTATLASTFPNIYLEQNFSESKEEEKYFFEGVLGQSAYQYENGQYLIDASNSTEPAHSVVLQDLSVYEIEAVGELAGEPKPKLVQGEVVRAGWGISFNYTSKGNKESFLLFLVNPLEKLFSLQKVVESKASYILSPTTTELAQPEKNVLGVNVNDGRITLKLNGKTVGEAFEPELTRGGFGLFVTPGTIARIDTYTVFTDVQQKAIFVDDFSGSPQRWFSGYQDGVTYKYRDSAYIIDTSETEKSGISLFPGYYRSFEMEVEVKKIQGADNFGYGVFFQDVPNLSGGFDHFRFLISNDGWFTIQRSFEDIPRAIYEWTQSEQVKPSQENTLRVRLANSTLKFYINDEEVYELSDVQEIEGKLGLYVSSGLIVRFDNFRLAVYE